ncbi:MAG: DUF6295 family protein [Dehalococcoidia bacterium]
MCTMIVEKVSVTGVAKGGGNWFPIAGVNVGYDHPFRLPLEHAVTIDFVNEAQGPSARVAVELTPQSAQQLLDTLRDVLEQGAAAEAA